jgi:hypothetical protein
MARTFGSFAQGLRETANELPVRVNVLKVKAASTIVNDLIQSTPVDTGEAMSNWIVNPGEASTAIRAPFVPSPRGYVRRKKNQPHVWVHRVDPEATRQANLGPARAQAEVELAEIQPGEDIHITNNTPQIVPLNDGTPSRTGLFFVDRSIELARGIVGRSSILRD